MQLESYILRVGTKYSTQWWHKDLFQGGPKGGKHYIRTCTVGQSREVCGIRFFYFI
jgi:hypothetical protein